MSIIVSANKIADFIVAKTPQRRKAIVNQVIRSKASDKGYAPYYSSFGGPAKKFLEGGAVDHRLITEAIRKLKTRNGSRWNEIDSRITREAFSSLINLAPAIQNLGVDFLPNSSRAKAYLEYPGIKVTVTPDLIVHGKRKGIPLIGAARFYLAKESTYQLGAKGAALVATMEYLWTVQNATGERAPDASLCMVLECLQQRVTVAPTDTSLLEAQIERGCRDFILLWDQLSRDEAAK